MTHTVLQWFLLIFGAVVGVGIFEFAVQTYRYVTKGSTKKVSWVNSIVNLTKTSDGNISVVNTSVGCEGSLSTPRVRYPVLPLEAMEEGVSLTRPSGKTSFISYLDILQFSPGSNWRVKGEGVLYVHIFDDTVRDEDAVYGDDNDAGTKQQRENIIAYRVQLTPDTKDLFVSKLFKLQVTVNFSPDFGIQPQ